MDYRDEALAILADAEKGVLSLLSQEAALGRYEGIEFARLVAIRLRDLRNDLSSESSQPSRINVSRIQEATLADPKKSGKKRRLRKTGKYPRFEVRDGVLVKIGWSRKEKTEYSQRIPEPAFMRVLDALGTLQADGNGSVTGESILAAVDDQGDEPIPSYQSYAVLRFLRSCGVIRMPSRGEYVLSGAVVTEARAAFINAET